MVGSSASLDGTLFSKNDTVVLLIELLERSSIDGDDTVLDQSLGTDQLVGGGVVHNIDNTSSAGAGLSSPGEVSGLQTKSAELLVSTHGTDSGHLLGSQLGVGGRATHFVFTFLDVHITTSTGGASFVSGVTRDTHID